MITGGPVEEKPRRRRMTYKERLERLSALCSGLFWLSVLIAFMLIGLRLPLVFGGLAVLSAILLFLCDVLVLQRLIKRAKQ